MTVNYWKKRQDALMAGLDKKDEKFSTKLAKEYDRLKNELEKEIAYYYQKYGSDDILEYRTMMSGLSDSERDEIFKDFDTFIQNNPEHANLLPIRQNIYKLNRLEGLQMSVRMKMAELGLIEQDLMTEYLKTSYKYGYEATMKNLKNALSFFSINNSLLQQALSNKWFNEKNYSDRIWDNKDTLRNWLINDFKDGIIAGKNYDAMIKSLMQRVDTGKFYAKRLVWTESAFFMNTANAHAFMEDGITHYRYTAIIDSRTSKICSKLDHQIFEFKDYKPGINAPPMHSFCRSTIVPVENDRVIEKTKWANEMSGVSQAAEDALNKFHLEIAEHGFQTGKEMLGLIDAMTGKILYSADGTNDAVEFDDKIKKLLKNANPNSFILSHNHPGKYNSSFSKADIITMFENDSIKALTLQTTDGSQMLLDKENKNLGFFKKIAFSQKFDNIERQIILKYGKDKNFWGIITNERNKEVAKYYRWKYRKVK